jgi:hypothetical protein
MEKFSSSYGAMIAICEGADAIKEAVCPILKADFGFWTKFSAQK